ncbi:hypothetical protein V6N13_047511 [Hibiscus sabdariffa]|uniref:Transmembrane protein n=1 Tax=Hibiscus sabdariffa TaxID=183260 RepID=A0ABR2F4D7_9ROSI
MGCGKFVKTVVAVVIAVILSSNPMTMPLARPLNEEAAAVAGVVPNDHSPVPPFGTSCGTNIPIPCPPRSSKHR